MSDEQRNLEVVRQLARCWNSCDDDALLAFYDDGVDMIADPNFPDPTVAGKPAVAAWIEGWRGSWQELEMVVDELEASGDRVVAIGGWETRGAASGIGGHMPWGILYTLRDGLVVRHEWFLEPQRAREASNLALVRRFAEHWNDGDMDAFVALLADDIEMISDPEWPEPDVIGKPAFIRYAEEWRAAWASAKLNLDPVEASGDEVTARGWWDSRGAASGVTGELAFGLLFLIRDGLIVRQQWSRV